MITELLTHLSAISTGSHARPITMEKGAASGVNLETTRLGTITVVPLATLSALTDGRAPRTTVSRPSAVQDVMGVLASAINQMNASVTLDGRVLTVTSALSIQVVSTVLVKSHGSASVTKVGVAYSVIKISISARTISHARMEPHVSTPPLALTHVNALQVFQAQTVKSSTTLVPRLRAAMVALAWILVTINLFVSALRAIRDNTVRSRVSLVLTDLVSMVPHVLIHTLATNVVVDLDMRVLIVNVQ